MKLKQWQNIFHVIVNVNSKVKHVIQIKNRIMKYVDVSVKFTVHAKKAIAGILAHVFGRMKSIL